MEQIIKLTVENNVYNFISYNKPQIIGKTTVEKAKSAGNLLPLWKIECHYHYGNGKKLRLLKASISFTPTYCGY